MKVVLKLETNAVLIAFICNCCVNYGKEPSDGHESHWLKGLCIGSFIFVSSPFFGSKDQTIVFMTITRVKYHDGFFCTVVKIRTC